MVLPLTRPSNPGIHVTLESTTASAPIAVPERAIAVLLWFDNAGAMVAGRIAVDQANTPITGLTYDDDDDAMGYLPAAIVKYELRPKRAGGYADFGRHAFLHVACETPGAVVMGQWLFWTD